MSSATVTLRVFSGGQCVATHRVARDIVKIGRLATSHLRLDNDAIARMHAVLEVNGTDVRLVDLGSATGTIVNGAVIDRSTAIQPGDRIELGPYTVFVDMDAAPAIAARPDASAVASPAHEHVDAAPVAQVVARWNDRVIDVQHIGHTSKRRVDSTAWITLGALLTIGGAGLFAHELGQDWTTHQEQVRAAAEVGAPAPAQPGFGAGGLGIALAFAGLVPLGLGLVGRRDRARTSYVLGDGPDASLTMAGDALPQTHTLVARDERGVVLSVSPTMRGHLESGGVRHDLRELVARGGSSEIALQTGATARVELGSVTFDVAAVAPGRVIAGRSEADKTYWLYNAASFTVIGSMLGLSQLIPDDALAMGTDETLAENRYVGYLHQPDEEKPAEETPVEDGPTDSENKAGLSGERHAGTEGAMGNPDRPNVRKMYGSKGPKTAVPQLARNFDPDLTARNAGILGMAQLESGHFLASPHGAAFAVGNDDEDVWGNLQGDAIGESGGAAGLGLVGTGRGGGGEGEGTVGLTGVGTIGQSGSGGDRLGYGNSNGRDSGTAFESRRPKQVKVRMPAGDFRGVLDKELIRRVVRVHLNEVRGCYDQGLARDPNLRGRVEIQFAIGPTGAVSSAAVSETSLDDENVGRCIAKAVKRWRFPTNAIGGTAMVSYPFLLETGG